MPPTGIEAIANDFDSDGAAANAGAASTRNTPTPTTLPRNHNPRTTRRDRRHRTLRAHITTDRCTPRKRTCSATTSAPAPAPAARSSCAIRRACQRGPGDRFRDPRCTRRTIPLATHRSPASRSVPAIAPQRTGSASPPLVGHSGSPGGVKRRPFGDEQERRRQALETRFGVTTVLRAGPPTRALPLPTRGSVDGPHARALASRPKCHGVLAEIETAPPRADCSSRGTGLPRGACGGVVTRLQLRVGSHGPGWCAASPRRRRTYFSSNKRRSEGSRSRSLRMMFPSVL